MFEVIRWISIVLLWVAIAANIVSLIRCVRTNKKLKESCGVMERLIKSWEEDHLALEEDSDGRND
jgi:hypothetical protein